jgi:hypothetical protein
MCRKYILYQLLNTWRSQGVFGCPGELRKSHHGRPICWLVARLGPSRYCSPHTEKGSQPGRVGKLDSSLSGRPSHLIPQTTVATARSTPIPSTPTYFPFICNNRSSCGHAPPLRSPASSRVPSHLRRRQQEPPPPSSSSKGRAGALIITRWKTRPRPSLRLLRRRSLRRPPSASPVGRPPPMSSATRATPPPTSNGCAATEHQQRARSWSPTEQQQRAHHRPLATTSRLRRSTAHRRCSTAHCRVVTDTGTRLIFLILFRVFRAKFWNGL